MLFQFISGLPPPPKSKCLKSGYTPIFSRPYTPAVPGPQCACASGRVELFLVASSELAACPAQDTEVRGYSTASQPPGGGGLESGAQSRTVCGSFRVLAISFWFKSHRTMWTELDEWTFMNECLMGETFRPVRIPSYIFFPQRVHFKKFWILILKKPIYQIF